MDDLKPITHKEFNELIKGKGFKGRHNYKLKELKVMFGFKPMVLGSPITISLAGEDPKTFDSISKASTSTGILYSTLLYVKRKSKLVIHSNGNEYIINLTLYKLPHSNFKQRSYENSMGVGKCSCGQTLDYSSPSDMDSKLRLHLRFCKNLSKGTHKIGIPKKAWNINLVLL